MASKDSVKARSQLNSLLIGGLLCSLIAVLLLQAGSDAGALGMPLLLVGQVLLLIGCVGHGVQLGSRAAQE